MKQFNSQRTLPQPSPSLSPINSVKEFRLIIELESKRADRYGLRISLAVFEVKSSKENNVVVKRLIRVLRQRTRSADVIGWYGKNKIGVLLPHTTEKGACKVTEDVYALLSSTDFLPPYTVYTYPSGNWPVRPKRTTRKIFLGLISLCTFSSSQAIPDSVETRAALDLEMDRAIRHNYIFSLVIFDLDRTQGSDETLAKITRAIPSNLRDTDTYGWYRERSLAVILPYATTQQARTIGQRIADQASLPTDKAFKVFTYPTNWFDGRENAEGYAEDLDAPKLPKADQERRGETSMVNEGTLTSPLLTGEEGRGVQPSEIDSFIAKPLPFWKRGMDITGALIALIVFSPLFLIAATGIKLSSPGPILFFQERVGFQKKKFRLIKFRSMHINSGAEHHRKFMENIIVNGEIKDTKLQDDPRIFPFGKFLRKSSIDEIPQLFNILKGEMSLVGPRPCMEYEADLYLSWHTKRFYTMPGLTGLWQVSGKNLLSFKEMIRLDIHYQKHLSLLLDLTIIVKTIPAIISIFFTNKNLS